MICKYCGKEIPKGEVWNPDENGNGYHHRCLIDMEFDENEVFMKDLKNRSITIPDNATNGDMIKAMFPNVIISESEDTVHLKYPTVNSDPLFFVQVSKRWWNAPYKKEVEE